VASGNVQNVAGQGTGLTNGSMRAVYAVADNIWSPLGRSSTENFTQLTQGNSGIRLHESPEWGDGPFFASLFSGDAALDDFPESAGFSRFERLVASSLKDALNQTDPRPEDPRTLFILSSTKGNVDRIGREEKGGPLADQVSLQGSAQRVARHFHFYQDPLVICHACISGSLAIITGFRQIRNGRFDRVVISGGDLLSPFILSGFRSFQAVSPQPCRPFDAHRDGVTLGEGAATLILDARAPDSGERIRIYGGSVSNDANHISGPSRTGQELNQAISRAIDDAGISPAQIGFISAHGTATRYNDEMEARALNLAGLQSVPLHSLKGNYGHTLGAAGLIETVAAMHGLRRGQLLPTRGFSEPGTTCPVNVSRILQEASLGFGLKTASGFGGCNAALVLGTA